MDQRYPASSQVTASMPSRAQALSEPQPVPTEHPSGAFQALEAAAAEAALASAQYLEARARWHAAMAGHAEAMDRVKRATEAAGI
jgi:hypothetical protein